MCGNSQVQASIPASAGTACVVIHKCKQPCLEAQAPNVWQFVDAGNLAWRCRHRMCGNSQMQASMPASASTECVVIRRCRQPCLEAQAANVWQFSSAGKHACKRRRRMRGNSQVQATLPAGAGTECVAIHRCRQPCLRSHSNAGIDRVFFLQVQASHPV